MSTEERYLDFASKISFFEFIQDEFRKSDFDERQLAALSNEIKILQSRTDWDINSLSDYIEHNPKSFLIFQGLFQLLRFTNAQLIHFVFDVTKMNSLNLDGVYEYAVYNLKHDSNLKELFLRRVRVDKRRENIGFDEVMKNQETYSKKYIVALFKMVVSDYVAKISNDFGILETRIKMKEFSDFSTRLANYLLTNLRLNEHLRAINLREYLGSKQIPVDTKGLHGNYATLRLKDLLKRKGFSNIDGLLQEKNVTTLKRGIKTQIGEIEPGTRLYCTEKKVEGVTKPLGGLKKFDIILIVDGVPKHLIETNFYTTAGTKIGINRDEYVALYKSMKDKEGMHFHWVTDGNFWLSEEGRKLYMALVKEFGEVYNLNTFEEHLNSMT